MSPWIQTLLPVAAGFAVVLIGILVFKLHAFLALILAAVTTAALTPDDMLFREALEDVGYRVEYAGQGAGYVLHRDRVPDEGLIWYVVDPDDFLITRKADAQFQFQHDYSPLLDRELVSDRLGVNLVRGTASRVDQTVAASPGQSIANPYEPEATDVIVSRNTLRNAIDTTYQSIPTRIATAFGGTVGEIGILIAFAAIIGMCLLDSGAADRIVRSALKLVGERGAPVAFTGSGFLLAVPVFFDTVFFLMIPLGKAMRLRTGRNYILYVLTIYCGATMAHSLVPPTPGPLLVAESLDVEIGVMMLVGTCVGLVTASYGILHAWLVNRWIEIPLRDTPDMPLADLEKLAAKPDHELPPLWLSLLPIVLPVWLIAQTTAIEMVRDIPSWTQGLPSWLFNDFAPAVAVLGEKNTALGIGVAIAMFLLIWQTRSSLRQVRDRVGMALAAGGSIILITAAGGAFGEIIAQTGVASLIQDLPRLGTVGLLTLAFLVTVTIRTVQGSATVAMITAVGLFAGIEIPVHPVWLALAIGCGSKPISWMTDSGFWVICKMSGMTEAETLKTLTPMTIMMGLVGLATVLVGATLFPLR